MNGIINSLLISVLCLLTTTAFAAKPEPLSSPKAEPSSSSSLNIVGNYACSGRDLNGGEYNNLLTVSSTGNTYTFQWNDRNGYPIEYGTGVVNSNLQNLVAVVYWSAKNLDQKGILAYELKPDGSLQGTWTARMESKIGTETCTRNK